MAFVSGLCNHASNGQECGGKLSKWKDERGCSKVLRLIQRIRSLPPMTEFTRRIRMIRHRLTQIWQGNPLFLLGIILFCLGFSFLVYHFESASKNEMFKTFGDGVWWFFVSATTTGYGDKYPITAAGRMLGVIAIVCGTVIMSLVTASISSILVERRLQDKMGLGQVTFKNHTIICGWNKKGGKLVQRLSATFDFPQIVLINDLSEEEINDVQFQFGKTAAIKFIKGDYALEATVNRANILHAKMVFILADDGPMALNNDERAALATLTMKSIQPDLKICAEITKSDSRQHLVRAGADGIVVQGEYDESLLALSLLNPGVSELFKELIASDKTRVRIYDIPKHFIGGTFNNIVPYFREKNKVITLGIVAEDPKMSLESILTDDFSQIDNFIKKMFEEAGISSGMRSEQHLFINPPDDMVIEDGYKAVVIV
ncbi:MAG: potassium channel family protein [Solirubrobacterales bacterium]